jgi:hypothetical protein
MAARGTPFYAANGNGMFWSAFYDDNSYPKMEPQSQLASSKSAESKGKVPGPRASRKRATSASCLESMSILGKHF